MFDVLKRLLDSPVRPYSILELPLGEYLAGVSDERIANLFWAYGSAYRQPTLRNVLGDVRLRQWLDVVGGRTRAPLERELRHIASIVDEEYILDEVVEPPPEPAARQSLGDWAADAGVADLLREPVRVLERHATREQRSILDRYLGNVGDLARGKGLEPRADRGLLSLATRYVREAGERAMEERAEDERVARLGFVPAGEQSRAFLAALDEALVRTGKRRTYTGASPHTTFERERHRLFFRWRARDKMGRERPTTASLSLHEWASRPLEAAVVLEGAGRPASKLDQVLRFARRVVADPKHLMHPPLAAYLDEPAWKRALVAMDGLTYAGPLAPPIVWMLATDPPRLLPHRATSAGLTLVDASSIGYSVYGTPNDELVAHTLLTHTVYGSHDDAARDARRQMFRALRLLVGSPNVVGRDRSPASVREGTLDVALEDGPAGARFVFSLDGKPIEPAALRAALGSGGYLIHSSRKTSDVVLAHVGSVRADILMALTRETATFPPEARSKLLKNVVAMSPHLPIDIPDSLLEEEAGAADPRPTLRLERLGQDAFALSWFVVPMTGGSPYVPGAGPSRVLERLGGRIAAATRDLAEEARLLGAVRMRLPLADREDATSATYYGIARCLELVTALRALVEASEASVVWPKQVPRVVGEASFSKLHLSIGSRGDWFGVQGKVDAGAGGEIPLEILLAAARARQRFVAIGADRFVQIEEELQAKLLAIGDVTRMQAKGRGLPQVAIPALLDAIGARDGVDAAPEFWTIVARIDGASQKDAAVPRRFKPVLRPYQVDGYRWMSRIAAWGAGACLADEMGLGKTVQGLALLEARKASGPALVVAPTSVGPNWIAEAKRFAPGLQCILHRGKGRAAALEKLGPGDVVVTNYELLARDAAAFAKVRFGTMIADEAQAIKTGSTARARAARAIDAEFRLALTGTPVENRLAELYSLMEFLNPGLFGSAEEFREQYVVPIERDRDPDRAASLARLVRPFLLRRRKRDVAAELPARTDVTRIVERGDEERQLYEAARKLALEAASGAGEGARFQVLAEIMRLRRLACHPQLFDERATAPSAKLEAFLEIAEELRDDGRRALVFSQFTGHLALVAEALRARGFAFQYLDGSTPLADRTRSVDAFQAGEGTLFLISLKAGGTGLNLTAADTVVHLDPWWNPAVEDQATDRAHRIGQTKPVTVLRLISQGTIEEAVLALHEGKRELAESILEGSAASGKLSMTELANLIREGVSEAAR